MDIRLAQEETLDLLLPLFAGDQRFYQAGPDEERNRKFLTHLLTTPALGAQYLATEDGHALGFATLYSPLSSVSA